MFILHHLTMFERKKEKKERKNVDAMFGTCLRVIQRKFPFEKKNLPSVTDVNAHF